MKPVSSAPETWAIVGGGMLGMTMALRLAQAGQRVTLFEGAAQMGGLASAWQLGNVVWDRHYHVTLLSDTALRGLLAELELEKQIQWVETKTGFYTDGKLYSMSNSVEFLQFPPLGLVDKFRLGLTILHASNIKSPAALEDIPVETWLRRWSGDRTTEKIWLPLLRAKLGENYKKASAAFLWAIIARMYAARRSGLKKEMFGYVPGGYARILEALQRKLEAAGVEIVLDSRAARVESKNTGAIQISLTNGKQAGFDQVVLTMPSSLAAELCPELRAEECRKLRGVEYQGIVCASLLLKKPLAEYYVTNITDEGIPFTAVIEMSAMVDRRQFGGNSLVYLPKYVVPDDPMFELKDDSLQRHFVAALSTMYPQFEEEDILAFKVSRVRQVFAIPTLHYSQNLPSMFTSVPGIQIVNSSHIVNGTLNVNETVQLAERAVPQMLARSPKVRRAEYATV
ncbi:MAG TPA: NAD(P)/FAD-dependent oxidoreductase [Terriglobales bacterium]|nr:NAD(P)/FAD-dependent oxidoreductase [Terriglobales bacterium]